MRLPRSGDRERQDAGVIPMINVVFLLLVFFMLAGAIRPGAPFETVPPQTDRSGAATPGPLVVHLDVNGELALNDERLSRSALVVRLSAAGLSAIESFPTLALRADAAVSFLVLRDTVDALREAGVEQVDLVTSSAPALAR